MIKNIERAKELLETSMDLETLSELLFNKLSCHEPCYADHCKYNDEAETGIIYEEHDIEVMIEGDRIGFVRLGINVYWEDGAGSYGPEDVEVL